MLTIITPNRQTANRLKNIEPATKSKPEIRRVYAINDWLCDIYNQWQKTLEKIKPKKEPTLGKLLSEFEEIYYWEKAIKMANPNQIWYKPKSLAKLCKEAWHFVCHYKVPEKALSNGFLTLENTYFLQWLEKYKSLLLEHQRIDFGSALKAMILAFPKDKILQGLLNTAIHLVNLDDKTPLSAEFFDLLKCVHTNILQTEPLSLHKIKLPSKSAELFFAAEKAKLWQSENKTVAIVIHDIASRISEVESVFRTILPNQYIIHVPIPLKDYPIVSDLLLFLSMLGKSFTFVELRQILLSPYFGVNNIIEKTALLKKIPLADTYTSKSLPNNFLSQKPESLTEQKNSTQWSELILQIISSAEWGAFISEQEKSIRDRFLKLLNTYAEMADIFLSHTFSEAIEHLSSLAETCLFLPNQKLKPIHILGVLEALGLPFDAILVTGVSEDAWPFAPAPNPFLPIALQKQYKLPKSSEESEYQMAKRMIDTLSKSAPIVIMSYPEVVRETKLKESRLILGMEELLPEMKELLPEREELTPEYGNSAVILQKNREKEEVETQRVSKDISGPSYSQNKLKGGSRVLALQAACPFRAFAEYRLLAKPKEKISIGFDPKLRGELLHAILNDFWHSLEGLSDLIALQGKVREQTVEASITRVFMSFKREKPHLKYLWDKKKIVLLEQNRLKALILKYLALEETRIPFKIVGHELKKTIVLEDLEITVRLDRIDRLETGQLLILDYKTGNPPSVSQWFSDRPEEPQLPLYALTVIEESKTLETLEDKLLGIAMIVINANTLAYKGIVNEVSEKNKKPLPGVAALDELVRFGASDNFESQLQVWKTSLSLLISEFKNGNAAVSPRWGEKTCQHCHLQGLCRINS